ncbi:uncharacterized protein LOC129599107 [Paramacrobiotus metropolitanus]|uniref:uncharacterized protein LOC129599107 n=1 Tax=Paramacrobiotus metropolitanus TaxID=2943436 RepID=UPI002446492B|nr:uncharacterized protein LOC129599107 [Paramacrobiotus metropolitanus]
MHALSVIVALFGLSFAAAFPFFGGGGSSKPAQVGACQWKPKDIGIIGQAVNGVGSLVGGAIGSVWGFVAPTSANQGAIAAASGDESQDQSNPNNPASGISNLGGRGIGGLWGAVVPNSVRCGSIAGAKATGNVGTSKKDPACDNYHWVDDNGAACTPSKSDQETSGAGGVTTSGGQQLLTPTITQTGSSFSITGTLIITYSSDSQRDAALQKLLQIWTSVLKSYKIQKATIKVKTVHRTDFSEPASVSYTVTGTVTGKINVDSAQQAFLTQAKSQKF